MLGLLAAGRQKSAKALRLRGCDRLKSDALILLTEMLEFSGCMDIVCTGPRLETLGEDKL